MRGIEDLGYRRSCYDPCVCCLMGESGPQGHILIEVDDLATHGNVVHSENMVKLQNTFKFGKWKSIYDSEGDYASRTVIQDKSYGFHIHQAKFVRERLSPIVIPKGRRSDKKSETSDGEKNNYGQCGVLSIGSNERRVQTCWLWHHLAWDQSVEVLSKTCVTQMQRWKD